MVHKKTPLVIDGYALTFHENNEKEYRLWFDGNDRYDDALNVFLGEVTQADRKPRPALNWKNIQLGIGRADQGISYHQYSLHDADVLQEPGFAFMKERWEAATHRTLDELFWMAGVSWDAPYAFIPHSSLIRILQLARDAVEGQTDQVVQLTVAQGSKTREFRPDEKAPL